MDEQLDNTEIDQAQAEETAAKMKRMATAVKAVAGWFSYFFGMAVIGFGTLNILEIFHTFDPLLTGFGLIISIGGIFSLFLHLKDKALKGKPLTVKLIKYAGGLTFIPGLFGIINLHKSSNLYNTFYSMFIFGLIMIFLSFILKKIWKIKTPKRQKKPLIEN